VHNQPFLQSEQLPVLLGKYQFYVQVSMTEGFPNALIEAMACGCVPIVSRVGAMPEIVGDTGYILEKKDPNLLQELIQKAISEYSPQKAMAARQRAADFTLEHRKKIMLDIFTSLDH
jgi:glycosyltransferase involved in cell wall biosynthesis